MTAFWDDKNGEIVLNDSVDISIAVATEKVSVFYMVLSIYFFVIARATDIIVSLSVL